MRRCLEDNHRLLLHWDEHVVALSHQVSKKHKLCFMRCQMFTFLQDWLLSAARRRAAAGFRHPLNPAAVLGFSSYTCAEAPALSMLRPTCLGLCRQEFRSHLHAEG